jgi:hypothetical protein
MSDSGRLRLFIKTPLSAVAWLVGTLLSVLAAIAFLFVTQPENRWAVWVVLALIVLFVIFVSTGRRWIETSTGTVVWQRCWVLRSRVKLENATSFEFVSDPGVSLAVAIRSPESRRRRNIDVLLLTMYVKGSMAPELLNGFADQIERWSHAQAYGNLPKQLRAQAKHVNSGGEPDASPLARQLTRRT